MLRVLALAFLLAAQPLTANAQRTHKPPLHGQEWMAVTGKPLGATAGAKILLKGGNAVDAACAMIAATATMWDVLHWGGETQALIYNPHTKKVIGINALGVAPTGATPEFFKSKGMAFPPAYGPLAAVTPGTPGGILVMLAEYGKLSVADVLEPAIRLADGFPIEAQLVRQIVYPRNRAEIAKWPDTKRVMFPNPGEAPPEAGQIFRQPELAATLRKLVEAERGALAAGKGRKDAIMAAYDRFYRGDIARELVAATRALGGLFTEADLANWKVKIEEPLTTTYRGVEVYKLQQWQQGPVMLQALNILENFDLKSMGYNSARYIHTVYQAMNLAYADRDFYYGDPAFPPASPMAGLLSKDYAKARAKLVKADRNDPSIGPGDPYPFQGATNPHLEILKRWHERKNAPEQGGTPMAASDPVPARGVPGAREDFFMGTTSVNVADKEGWVVSVTPSGGWVPAVIAGKTGIGLSQRMQSFVLDASENPFNVLAPGKRPRVTLTPTLAFRDGRPWMAFSVQGGDGQDQDLLQFFLNLVEFGMTPQEAVEAPGFYSFQMRASFDNHATEPGRIQLNEATPAWIRKELREMGYTARFAERSTGPITAVLIDRKHGTFWGAAGNHGEDTGIGW
jgi:gamma-glutamyltranspeptidase/glutathione hydrolase